MQVKATVLSLSLKAVYITGTVGAEEISHLRESPFCLFYSTLFACSIWEPFLEIFCTYGSSCVYNLKDNFIH